MENLTKEASDTVSEIGEKVEQSASQWPSILKDVVDKLTGKNMEVTYNFENFEIDVPKATGPQGKELGSAKWKINGKFILSTQLSNTSENIE